MPQWTIELDYNTLLICEEYSELEIALQDFDSSKSLPHTLSQEVIGDLAQLGIKYPTEDVDPFGNPVYLEIIITGSGDRRQAILHYGNTVSWRVPVEFAEQLQSILLLAKVAA